MCRENPLESWAGLPALIRGYPLCVIMIPYSLTHIESGCLWYMHVSKECMCVVDEH